MKPITAKCISTIGAMLIVTGLIGGSGASLADATFQADIDTPVVKQGLSLYPSFWPFRGANNIYPASKIITVKESRSLRSIIGEILAQWKVITPKKKIWLSVSGNGKAVDSVLWKFSEDDYFSQTDVRSDEVQVVASYPFLATAEVKFANSTLQTYTAWVQVD